MFCNIISGFDSNCQSWSFMRNTNSHQKPSDHCDQRSQPKYCGCDQKRGCEVVTATETWSWSGHNHGDVVMKWSQPRNLGCDQNHGCEVVTTRETWLWSGVITTTESWLWSGHNHGIVVVKWSNVVVMWWQPRNRGCEVVTTTDLWFWSGHNHGTVVVNWSQPRFRGCEVVVKGSQPLVQYLQQLTRTELMKHRWCFPYNMHHKAAVPGPL